MFRFIKAVSILLFFVGTAMGGAPRFSAYRSQVSFSAYGPQVYVPYSSINCMMEDHYGLMWIATENGLYRFNGYEYILYEQENSLPNNNVRKMLEDSKGRMWICTDNGIAYYDREHDRFEKVKTSGLTSKNILNMREDKDGTFWLVNYSGLAQISEDGTLLHAFQQQNVVDLDICRDTVWMASTQNGILYLNKQERSIEKFECHGLKGKNIQAQVIEVSNDGRLFVGTRNDGFHIVNTSSGEMKSYNTECCGEMTSDNVEALFEDTKGRMWIGTVNGKLMMYDTERNLLKVPYFQLPEGVERLTTSAITEDHEHNIWVGTHHYWIFVFNESLSFIHYIQRKDENSGTLSHNSVTCFSGCKDYVMVGTDGGGLNVLDLSKYPLKKEFEIVNNFGKVILCMNNDAEPDEYWVATWGNPKHCLFRYNRRTKKYKTYDYVYGDTTGLTSNLLRHLYVDGKYVWVTSDGGGLCRINMETDKIDNRYNCKENIFSKDVPQWINHLFKDKQNRYWFSTSEGVLMYDERNQFHRVGLEGISGVRLQNEVRMGVEDDSDIFFVTANHGLLKYDEKEHRLKEVTELYGMPRNLNAICVGERGYMWVTSNEEIIRVDKDEQHCHRFNMKNDLSGHSFTPRAILQDEAMIYVGSGNGIFQFDVNDVETVPSMPKVYLEHISVNGIRQKSGKSSVMEKEIMFSDSVKMDYDQNNISFEYYCVDLDNVEKVWYCTRLLGHDKTWSQTSHFRHVDYTNLAPGKYTFQVKCSTVNADQEFYSKPFTFYIKAPWWETWGFKVGIIAVIMLILFTLSHIREKNFRNRQEELERMVEDRTSELKQSSEELKEQKEALQQRNEELAVTIETKNRVLSVLAHDLRNPLTAIVGNLSLMSSGDGENAEELKQLYQSSKSLQTQMENLLEWARIQNNTLFYLPKDISMDALTKESITLHQDLLREKNIHFTYDKQCSSNAFADVRMVGTIIRNLLNNAIKYTYPNGEIHLSLNELENQVQWIISDNGVGMTADQLKDLREQKYSTGSFGTNNEKGSGLGLRICQQFIKVNQGTMTIESEAGKGTKITVSLPKGKCVEGDCSSTIAYSYDCDKMKEGNERKELLIVDDSQEMLRYERELLKPYYNVKTATDGEMAWDMVKSQLPDMVISDVVMPKMDGKELCHYIKSDPLTQHIPVILLTSEDSEESQVEGLNIGADDYVIKPFNGDILKAKVATILKNVEFQRNVSRSHYLQRLDFGEEEKNVQTSEDALMESINEIIKKNIGSANLTVEFLANESALSRVQLFRKMKAIAGCSPSEYIRSVRLNYAADLLKDKKMSISEIAYTVGFSDPKYFSVCFSEKFGISPSQYVKEGN